LTPVSLKFPARTRLSRRSARRCLAGAGLPCRIHVVLVGSRHAFLSPVGHRSWHSESRARRSISALDSESAINGTVKKKRKLQYCCVPNDQRLGPSGVGHPLSYKPVANSGEWSGDCLIRFPMARPGSSVIAKTTNSALSLLGSWQRRKIVAATCASNPGRNRRSDACFGTKYPDHDAASSWKAVGDSAARNGASVAKAGGMGG